MMDIEELKKELRGETAFSDSETRKRAMRLAADEIERLQAEVAALKTSLSYAIRKADGWHDECRGGDIDTPEMQVARDLCK